MQLSCRRRSNAIVTFVDESDMAPMVLDANVPLEEELFQMDHRLDFICQQPLCIEVWIDQAMDFVNKVTSFEPYHKQLIDPELGFMLR